MTIRIAIGCHSYVLGEGLKKLFKDDEGTEIIGIFDEGIDLKEIIKLQPDIILADLKIFRTFPESVPTDTVKILLISDDSWISEVERQLPELLLRGVCGILPPDADSDMLKKAVKIIYSGELWLDRKLLKNILYNVTSMEKKIDLTKKEKEIVSLICNGCRNKEIAQRLDISEQTVKSHCNRIYKKVGVSDRLQLALYTHKLWPGHI
ncbi:MAG: response regulator transcription factor [Nitrospirales bacterium]|jgi:DNA-binding NarL/FixJ family response regulator|nr:MAG: response regulator transcription factor [Nitrospirales bacterium]